MMSLKNDKEESLEAIEIVRLKLPPRVAVSQVPENWRANHVDTDESGLKEPSFRVADFQVTLDLRQNTWARKNEVRDQYGIKSVGQPSKTLV